MSEKYISLDCQSNSGFLSGLSMSYKDLEDVFESENSSSPNHFEGNIKIYYMDEDELELGEDEDKEDVFDAEYQKLCDFDKKYFAGVLNFHAYDLSAYDFSVFDGDSVENTAKLFYLMDSEGGDTELYYAVMERLLPRVIDRLSDEPENLMVVSEESVWLITLDRLYIDKKYRHNGIANYMMRNLYKIMKTSYHINAVFMCGACIPDKEDDIDNSEMIKIQKKPFKVFKYMEFNKSKDLKNTFCGCIHPDVE